MDPDPKSDPVGTETFYRIRIRSRTRSDPKLFAGSGSGVGSGVGSGINHFGFRSGQPLSSEFETKFLLKNSTISQLDYVRVSRDDTIMIE